MYADSGLLLDRAGRSDVDAVRAAAAEFPFAQRREVAQLGVRTARQDCGEEHAVERQVRPADRQDRRVLPVKPAGVDAMLDSGVAEAQRV
jgi:hypothetical protein